MSVSAIIFMNVGIAAAMVAILALVMLIPARLDAQHLATAKVRQKKLDGGRAANRAQHVLGARRPGLRLIRDEN